MKLVEIRGYHVECTLPQVVRNAVGTFSSRSSLVVELVSDSGLSGWGETQAPLVAWAYIEAALAPRLLGKDPENRSHLWQAMIGERTRGEPAMLAISALDMALWDLGGKASNKSVAELLGGRLRDRITAYASGPFMQCDGDPYRDFDREVDSYVEAGFTGLKARSGIDPRRDGRMASRLRQRIGPDFLLMVDINRGYSVGTAMEAARRFEEAELLWIEEPIGVDDLSGYRYLSQQIGTPIAAGEGLSDLADFRDFLSARAISIVQPDLFRCGGFTGALKIATLAETFDIPYVPHVWGTSINFNASLQFASTLRSSRIADTRTFPLFEYDRGHNPLIAVTGEPRLNADGTLDVPEGPGIGIAITRDTFASYVKKSWCLSL